MQSVEPVLENAIKTLLYKIHITMMSCVMVAMQPCASRCYILAVTLLYCFLEAIFCFLLAWCFWM